MEKIRTAQRRDLRAVIRVLRSMMAFSLDNNAQDTVGTRAFDGLCEGKRCFMVSVGARFGEEVWEYLNDYDFKFTPQRPWREE